MQLTTGTVLAGKLVVEGLDLPDGETLVVLTRETEDAVELSRQEEAELLEAIAETDRGETISAEELFGSPGSASKSPTPNCRPYAVCISGASGTLCITSCETRN